MNFLKKILNFIFWGFLFSKTKSDRTPRSSFNRQIMYENLSILSCNNSADFKAVLNSADLIKYNAIDLNFNLLSNSILTLHFNESDHSLNSIKEMTVFIRNVNKFILGTNSSKDYLIMFKK